MSTFVSNCGPEPTTFKRSSTLTWMHTDISPTGDHLSFYPIRHKHRLVSYLLITCCPHPPFPKYTSSESLYRQSPISWTILLALPNAPLNNAPDLFLLMAYINVSLAILGDYSAPPHLLLLYAPVRSSLDMM